MSNELTAHEAKSKIASSLRTTEAMDYFANTTEQNDWIVMAQREGVEATVEAIEDYVSDEE